MSQGPQRLGGARGVVSLRHLTPREAAAQAAERRARDDLRCPSAAIAAGEKLVIDLLDEVSDDEGGVTVLEVKRAFSSANNSRGASSSLGARTDSSNTSSGRTGKGIVAATAQLGKFAGMQVPGYSAGVAGRSSGPGTAPGSTPSAPDACTAGTSVDKNSLKCTVGPSVCKPDAIVDLIHSPGDGCRERRKGMTAHSDGRQHMMSDTADGEADARKGATVSASSKRARCDARTGSNSDAENSGIDKDRDLDKMLIDLT